MPPEALDRGGRSLESWRRRVADELVDLDIEGEFGQEINWSLDASNVADLQISQLAFEPHRIVHGKQQVEKSDSNYIAVVQKSGEAEVEYADDRILLKSGDILLFDTQQTYSINFPNPGAQMAIRFPASTLEDYLAGAGRIAGQKVSGDSGLATVFNQYCDSFVANAHSIEGSASTPLVNAFFELLLAPFLGKSRIDIDRQTYRQAFLSRLKKFIELRLGDPDLSVQMLAQAHGVTPRTIHNLFKSAGVTANRYIWHRRIDRCKSDLAAPEKQHLSITDIAFAWGFKDLSHFYRLFANETGQTPGDFRDAVIKAAVAPDKR